MQAIKQCSTCSSENPAPARFCRRCGTAFASIAVQQAVPQRLPTPRIPIVRPPPPEGRVPTPHIPETQSLRWTGIAPMPPITKPVFSRSARTVGVLALAAPLMMLFFAAMEEVNHTPTPLNVVPSGTPAPMAMPPVYVPQTFTPPVYQPSVYPPPVYAPPKILYPSGTTYYYNGQNRDPRNSGAYYYPPEHH